MFSLFTNKKETENDESHLSLISIAALLIHSAKIDQNFTEKERNIIKNALIEKFCLLMPLFLEVLEAQKTAH